jgi:hypothetical protein
MPGAGPYKLSSAASNENTRPADVKVDTPATADPIKKDLLDIPVIKVPPLMTQVYCKMMTATTNK